MLLTAGLGVLIAGTALLLPADVAVAAAILGFCVLLALHDTWALVIVLMLARSSLDALTGTGVLAEQNLAALLAVLLLVASTAHIALEGIDVRRVPLATPFLVLLAAWAAGAVVSVDPEVSLREWLRAATTFLLYVYLVHTLTAEPRRRMLATGVLLSAVVPVAWGLVQLLTGSGNQVTEGFNRVYGTFVHPSPYAVYLVAVLPLAAVTMKYSRPGLGRLLIGLLCFAMLVCIAAAFTRIAWAGLVITLIVLSGPRSRGLILVPAVVAVAVLLVPGINDRLFGSSNLASGESRLEIWSSALSLTSAQQLPLGLGLGSVEVLTGNASHNDYLRLWAESGAVGVLAFAWLYGALLRYGLRAARESPPGYGKALATAFVAVLLSRLVMMVTDNLTVHPVLEWYFWAFAAIVVAREQSRASSATPWRGAARVRPSPRSPSSGGRPKHGFAQPAAPGRIR